MKPAWDQLGDEFAGSKTVVIGDVDCTVHQGLCGKYGVRGYPTIKYFTSSTAADGDTYEGGRDYASLKKFADESLGPSCSNDNLDLCDDEQKAILDKYNAMSADERKEIVDKANKDVDDAEENFKAEVKKLQASYEKLMSDKDEGIKALQTPELRLLKSIKGDSKDEL
jgi:thioredoxin-like negative regulator of GroEL